MGAYILAIVGATVIGAVISVLTPDNWDKYVGIVTGVVITLCIARPVVSLINEDIFTNVPDVKSQSLVTGEMLFKDEVKRELQSKIAMDVKEKLKSEFGRECVARVEVSVMVNGDISGVDRILVRGDKIDAVAKSRLREIYGAREIIYEGP